MVSRPSVWNAHTPPTSGIDPTRSPSVEKSSLTRMVGEGGGAEGEGSGAEGGSGGGQGGGGEGGGGEGEGGGGEGGAGGGGGGHASAKVFATMRLRIERVQGGVALACRKAILLIVGTAVKDPFDRMRVEASEVGLTQSEHLPVTSSNLKTRRYVVPYSRVSAVVDVAVSVAPLIMASL